MPANSTASEIPAPTFDLLEGINIRRGGKYPSVALEFSHCGATDGSNVMGLPTYPRVRERTFTLFLDSGIPAALGKIAALQSGVAARIVAGETLDEAQANEAYDLLGECAALASTALISSQLGIQVLGANPFPE